MAKGKISLRRDVVLVLFVIFYAVRSEKNSQDRFAGYQIFVSNTANMPKDGVLCYEDTSSTKSAVQLVMTHLCPYVGRYVTVYNYRNNPKRYSWYSNDALLELCEVQVFGCQVGRYGDGDCDNQCPGECYGGNCNSKTAACFYCFTGKYGNHCSLNCPTNCKDNVCSKDTGICFDCVPQKCGIRCEQNCSTNCLDSLCENVNGYCYECIPGKFGNTRCDQNCPENCNKTLCEKTTGYCLDCIPGKHGNTCDQNCPGNCKDMLCEKSTGNCIDCVPQRYGIKCEQECSTNCQDRLCEKVNGSCNDCIPGRHSTNCDQSCSENCKDTCERDNGSCTDCIPGKHGTNCDRNCPGNCKDMLCERDNGSCKVRLSPVCYAYFAAMLAEVVLFNKEKLKSGLRPHESLIEAEFIDDMCIVFLSSTALDVNRTAPRIVRIDFVRKSTGTVLVNLA
ncbi:scavenger receptor class F member 1-like [Pecten maximus]|uniref:scavenger receptor class F member 1-like n=1 Tax=Pecten maximus TaxID=6579 RepID=UPI001458C7F2|nr:scavenger receptor class F member 1-like [Pecten maximus]